MSKSSVLEAAPSPASDQETAKTSLARKTPTPQLAPNLLEIAVLPRWCTVAYAARCARRAISFYAGDSESKTTLNTVVEICENAATVGSAELKLDQCDRAEAAMAILIENWKAGEFASDFSTFCIIEAVNAALETARYSASRSAMPTFFYAVEGIVISMSTLANIAIRCVESTNDVHASSGIAEGLHRDFDRLRTAVTRGSWDDRTPLLAQFFGNL